MPADHLGMLVDAGGEIGERDDGAAAPVMRQRTEAHQRVELLAVLAMDLPLPRHSGRIGQHGAQEAVGLRGDVRRRRDGPAFPDQLGAREAGHLAERGIGLEKAALVVDETDAHPRRVERGGKKVRPGIDGDGRRARAPAARGFFHVPME
jgi:hypothetical protein